MKSAEKREFEGDQLKKEEPQKNSLNTEDWWAVWLGFGVIGLVALSLLSSPVLPERWGTEAADTIFQSIPLENVPGLFITLLSSFLVFGIAIFFLKRNSFKNFVVAFPVLFLITTAAFVLGEFGPWRHYGFNDVIWALALGLFISNVLKTPAFLKHALHTELYIKAGLVLLGASILFDRMLALGLLGVGVAWIVTPIVIILMYWFSQRVLNMQDQRGLAITISSATAVCGVSAAIASGTAAKAKKEEITLAISITLIFTIIMMLGMPALVSALNIDAVVGGAWLGGTIDATGAVVAAGSLLGDEAMEVASVIKMVQNILIGFVAVAIALFFVSRYENKGLNKKVSGEEVWTRMPKFIIGFLGASLIFSFVLPEQAVETYLPVIDDYRGVFFALAFVSIGLESNFKELAKGVQGGKPIILYITGQLLNIILTLLAAWFFFSGHFFSLPF
ncbi:putative sulfate exporter family transporter [Salipaludibacillus keqinensis]|uniref:Putative sulfate exporter family transporter n=1 Tax=Salipaludibacillus keqinensis TaxID=2045207 RepID=A0A323T7Z0_9BACI|nr:putative sulfate exporter family transporter [Salipaludibacillus keqinensis]PYZ91729.1 putative sulfate exporter family transporter [Salipaludibacillus keqinensis]